MTVLDWFSIITMAAAILFLFFILLFIIVIFRIKGEQKKLSRVRTKNKKKKKKLFQQKKKLVKRKRKYWVWVILFLLFACASGAASYYTIYYQSTNLNEEDQQAIVNGYYYVEQTSNQLDKTARSEDTVQELGLLATHLSNFALKKANYRLNEEGQNLINKYYDSMKEFGVNLAANSQNLQKQPELLKEFLTDLEKVKRNQDKVLEHFRVNKDALKQQQK